MKPLNKHLEQPILEKNNFRHKIGYYAMCAAVVSYIALALFTLSSCSSDDDSSTSNPTIQQPSLSLLSGDTGLHQGVIGSPESGSLQYSVKAIAPEGFNQLVIQKVVDGIATEYETINVNHPNYIAGSNTFTYNLNYILNINDVDKDLSFKAIVTDANDNTTSLDFAEAEVKQSLQFVESLFIQTKLPIEPFNVNVNHFLRVDGDTVENANLGDVVNLQINEKVAAVFSLNDAYGYYLSSPNAVIETDFVIEIQDKATTKFKEIDSESVNFDELNIYDTYEIETIYNNASFNTHQQRATQLEQGKLFSMLTDDGKIALFKITYFNVEGGNVYAGLEMYISKLPTD
ncbi:hypothetical protein [Ichthyenterobacterium magnum]|uniref:Uncharacterized protein n=1 Tax=Ichthyenterobacterium magnum TaxID=1230530 RepID=A0A420DGS2_9FLAO|nr:hypothetical protein [Ichthyenterobacterium magnum]RKE92282.1 hypothetical protein BXY80_2200 [Ichthyenterobacterium magnum]